MKNTRIVIAIIGIVASLAYSAYLGKIKYIYVTNIPNRVDVSVTRLDNNQEIITSLDFSNDYNKAQRIYDILISAQANDKTIWFSMNSAKWLLECSVYTNYGY